MHRARFLFEVVDAVISVWGSDRVGLRISPLNSYNSMMDSDPVALVTYLAKSLNECRLAYLHVMRRDFIQQQEGDVLTPVRENFDGVLITNMGYSAEEAAVDIDAGKVDAVSFGTSFLANPDLPGRFAAGADLNAPDASTFYTPWPKGYTDYPVMAKVAVGI